MSKPRIILLALIIISLFIFPVAAGIPASYDYRLLNLTPPITDQGNFGLCWAFSVISSLESSMIHQDQEKYAGIDLSPYHLAYFTYNRDEVIDPDSPLPGLEGIAGDYTHANEAEPISNISGLAIGGYDYQAVYTLAAGFGAVNESAAAFEPYGNNTRISPDTAISRNEVMLKSVIFIPVSDTDTIKTMLIESGAGVLEFFFAVEEPYLHELDDGKWVYYLGTSDRGNISNSGGHAVTLIGWDDDFSKGYFNMTPEHDGAWLIQNSWGSNLSNSTYIWISYDETIDPIPFFTGYEPKYDHIYQYDGGTLRNEYPVNRTSALVGNVFTAGGDELIRAVSLDTNQSVNYTLEIYTSPTTGSPDSGTLFTSQTGVLEYPGYYTIELTDPVPIEEGQSFSVVYSLESEELLNISIDESAIVDDVVETTTFALPGQSFVNNGTTWEDLSADGETNLRIKAFTTDTTFTISIDPVAASIKKRGIIISGTTTFAPGSELNVSLTSPNGSVIHETAEVMPDGWEVIFPNLKMFEEEYMVFVERKSVSAETVFTPAGFKDMLIAFRA